MINLALFGFFFFFITIFGSLGFVPLRLIFLLWNMGGAQLLVEKIWSKSQFYLKNYLFKKIADEAELSK